MPDISMPDAEEDDQGPDVLPEPLMQGLIAAWLLLFGGRWLLAPVLQWNLLLSPTDLHAWDENILLKLYLVLLAITLIVVALRWVRGVQARSAQASARSAISSAAASVDPTPASPAPNRSNREETCP